MSEVVSAVEEAAPVVKKKAVRKPKVPFTKAQSLKVKVGTVNRLVKEVAHYEEDTAMNVARVQGMKDDAAKDAWDVKKADEVLEEARMMIPDATRRLVAALDDLYTYVGDCDGDADATSCEAYGQAQKLLETHDALISS
ncbi:tubulin binding cofactor A [Pelagophyceae sp. CCMP2097]|nr:tubulin binding cofactor A [Pelagophyceae sp. CCMP2097]|mmetsp:Transcript_9231/g.30527  ORF Transcript_9231/g.30527 Transcript_9231/m.30527 type:complete len:139 (+) Transcript_9231:32-448(+)|eukprot:CAMPEP_0184094598 /NCGR_PEP_ID=MMETSP0974-20121125/9343_1 /TAXON_ID=483370 /ORGANISM="non described non described, Strain CCMP2097" /LENGTH=138 /DNA_ID=CAMNT_0026397387 /DNA_START=32 /DNA_END=448 /DNA_ORIENTATION=+